MKSNAEIVISLIALIVKDCLETKKHEIFNNIMKLLLSLKAQNIIHM